MITRAEAAQALGVSKQAVYKAVTEGRLTSKNCVDGQIRVNSETMYEEWTRNSQSRIGVGPKPPGEKVDKSALRSREERLSPRITKTSEAVPDYNESRARTEHLKAELLELERKQKEGLLVSTTDVEAKWVEIVVMARTKILGIPTKAKQRIPDLDVDAIEVLDAIVRETLEDLAGQAPEDDE
jgi:phage terminase Nu1 subunit (DNA packaging protein)